MKAIKAVIELLTALGYQYDADTDDWFVKFAVSKVESHIKNNCNISRVPAGLFHAWVRMAAGEFLLAKKATGTLNIESLDLDGAVKKINEGDTIVEFAYGQGYGSLTPEQRFDMFVGSLLKTDDSDFAAYRKVCW